MERLDLIWEDAHGLAVSKPAGLLTQPARPGWDELTLEALVRDYLRPDAPDRAYLGTIHRLDRPVSGVILWAKTPRAAARWAQQFASRQAHKEYWAVAAAAAGTSLPAPIAGIWEDWLLPPGRTGRASVVPPGTPGALRAVTRVEPGEPARLVIPDAGLAWLRLFPETGRTHQLRVQAAARGWPVVGDVVYGSAVEFAPGIALHARRLAVEHPARREPMTLEAPPPPSWAALLDAM